MRGISGISIARVALSVETYYGKLGQHPQGEWLSRLERTVHIREVTGSNPVSPTGEPLQVQGFFVQAVSRTLWLG